MADASKPSLSPCLKGDTWLSQPLSIAIKSAKTLARLPPRYLNAVPRQYSINQAFCALMFCFKMFRVQVSSATGILNKPGTAQHLNASDCTGTL